MVPKSNLQTKSRFTLPLRAWIKRFKFFSFRIYTFDTGIKKRNLFKEDFLKKTIDDEYNDISDNSQKIWQLLTLEQWFRNNEK